MISSCSLVSRFCLANDSLESPDFKFSIASGTSLNFAESLKEAYRFLVYQNQRFIDNVQVVRLLNDVIEINPQDIKDIDFDLNISQSLSSGWEDTRRRALNNALAMMIEIGEPRNLTDNMRIRNLMAKILEESGLKDTENYLIGLEKLREQAENG